VILLEKIQCENKGFEWEKYASLIGLLVLVVVGIILNPSFLNPQNLMNILRQNASAGFLAIGMTFVILTAGIDLSVGSFLGFSGVVLALLIPHTGVFVAIIITLLLGALIGISYGWFITDFNVPPFIATLAGLSALRGIALVASRGGAVPVSNMFLIKMGVYKINPLVSLLISAVIVLYIIYNYNSKRNNNLIETIFIVLGISCFSYIIYSVGGLNIQVFLFLLAFGIFWFLLNKTVFGREVYAIGGNLEAAGLSGIKVKKDLILVYVMSATLATFGGILTAARLGTGAPNVGTGGELDAIAAVVIGGTSFSGGIGNLSGTFIGVLLMGVLKNVLSLYGVSSNAQMIFKGLIILIAVIIDTQLKHKNA